MSAIPAMYSDEMQTVLRRVAESDQDIGRLATLKPPPTEKKNSKLVDLLPISGEMEPPAKEVFDRLRWGGQVVFVSAEKSRAVRYSLVLGDNGFEITRPPAQIARKFLGVPIPFLSKRTNYFVARKVQLIQPGKNTDRFTFHVYLQKKNDQYSVVKEVPTLDMVMARLRNKWPQRPEGELQKQAKKFSERVFPIFLTREAAILKIVNRDLPPELHDRVPKLLEMEKDEKGYARRLRLSWLRNGGEPLSQIEFARQSADLLRVLHDKVGVMHLDLRLDNFVITPDGVGFVDFGSAVRVDENLKQNPLLSSLFEELMRTSEIQRMLFSMTRTGQVTSEAISCGLHKVDKAVDYFYLAVQIASPHSNPDLKDLIRYNRDSEEAKQLTKLTEQILRPPDPAQPIFRSARDILKGIEDVREKLAKTKSA